jgi:nitroimidazol reductase NimA-like FMN-containing flavoprotein (pyridoxamine 5'-phosphate oxidase superfamily)
MIELTLEQCEQILAEEPTAFVACLSEGEPYVAPMSYVIDSGDVCFRTGRGRRTEALAANPRVCVAVSRSADDGSWQSVILWGEARLVEDPGRESEIIAGLLHKYGESGFEIAAGQHLPVEKPVYAVTPDRVSGRASGGGLSPSTHPGRL